MTERIVTLAALERAESELPEDLLALTEGTASEAQLDRLRRDAASDASVADRIERFRPFSGEEDDALASYLVDSVVHRRNASMRGPTPRAIGGPTPRAIGGPTPSRATSVRRFWSLAVGLGVAAAMVVAFLAARDMSEPLPSYRVEASSGDLAVRSVPPVADDGRRYASGSSVTIIIRPELATPSVALDTFVLEGETLRPHPVKAEVSTTGAIRIQGPVDDVFFGLRGEVTLLFVVRKAARERPSAAEVYSTWAQSQRPPSYRVVAYRCRVER